jgi:hypothetical protein
MALHSREHLDAIREKSVSHWKRQMAAKAAERESLAKSNAGLVAAARAERDSGKPLVVESLEAKLEKAIPGAVTKWSFLRPSHECWAVWLEKRVLATGGSEREAIDRAIFLFGGR